MSKKRRFTREEEDGRIQGLRLLARIIARHYLEHPELYPAPRVDIGGGTVGAGNDDTAVGAAALDGGKAARKEANQ